MQRCRIEWFLFGFAGCTAFLFPQTPVLAQPANDLCANAATIAEGVTPFDLDGATGEDFYSCDLDFNLPDVWFNYSPSEDGTAIISTCGFVDSGFSTTITVLDTCDGAQLGCDSATCFDHNSTLALGVSAGTHYLIRVASGDTQTPAGSVGITLLPRSNCTNPAPGAPANDCCEHATHVSEGTFPFTTVGATQDYTGPCTILTPGVDVWFDYAPSASGTARIFPDSDAPETLTFVILEGSCDGAELVCAADGHRGRRQAVFTVNAGSHYLIRVADLVGEPASGHIVIQHLLPPANDQCIDATPISGLGTFAFDNTIADNSGPDDAPACDGFGGFGINHDVWFLWTNTLPLGQDAVISTCGGTFVDTKIAAYPAPCPVGQPLACNDDTCFNQSTISFTPTPGARYLIRIGNWPGFNGDDGPDGEPGAFTIDSQPTCTLTPPAGAFIEPEACGEDTNGGCDSPGFGFTDIPCGTTTIFGTAPVFAGFPDQDYYRIQLPAPATLTFSGTAEFRMQIAILDEQCPPNVYARTIFPSFPCDDPETNPLQSDLPAGTYVLGVVNASPDSPCGAKNNYILTVSTSTCTPVGRCCIGASCDVMSQADCIASGGSYAGDATSCPPPGGNYHPSACNEPIEDISAFGAQGDSCDDCGNIVDIGFDFSYFGQSFSQVGMSSDGYLTFNTDAFLGISDNEDLPRSGSPNYICPLWDDFRTDSGEGAMYTATLGTAPHRRFVAMWKNVESFDIPGSQSTFEAILFEGSNTIAFRYGGLDPNNTPTVGVNNADGTAGITLDLPTSNSCTTLTLGPAPSPCCPADFNADGALNSQDFFDFLNAFFMGSPTADFNHDSSINSQDFFDFLNAFFAGC